MCKWTYPFVAVHRMTLEVIGMSDEYCRALCELADGVHGAVSLWVAGDVRSLGGLVNRIGACAVSLSDRLLHAFCPSLPRTEALLLVESLHTCVLTVQLVALTLPPCSVHDPMGASLRRLSTHLRQEIATLPRQLRGKRDAQPSPRSRAEVREETMRLRTRLCLRARQVGSSPEEARAYDALLTALSDAEARYLTLALECS